MLNLTIRTDKPEAEIGLYENDKQLAYETWPAHRQLAETIHQKIKMLLGQQGHVDWRAIEGIVLYKGPGSFTGLRIGAAVANTLASELAKPIIGESGIDWRATGIARLRSGQNDQLVQPEYGAPVHITPQKK